MRYSFAIILLLITPSLAKQFDRSLLIQKTETGVFLENGSCRLLKF